MERIKESFKSLVNDCIANQPNTYIGIGDYENAVILFVGKEGSAEEKSHDEISSAEDWKKVIDGETCGRKTSESSDKYKYPDRCTWGKYQKLHDYIHPEYKHTAPTGVNFTERIFATEMSDVRCKNTGTAQKNPMFEERLRIRKENFFKTDFIQSFPVVVLACSDYISKEEICCIFGVEDSCKKEVISSKSSFQIYYNPEHTKMVVHTRQLSGSLPDRLLKEIGGKIREFMQKNGLINH